MSETITMTMGNTAPLLNLGNGDMTPSYRREDDHISHLEANFLQPEADLNTGLNTANTDPALSPSGVETGSQAAAIDTAGARMAVTEAHEPATAVTAPEADKKTSTRFNRIRKAAILTMGVLALGGVLKTDTASAQSLETKTYKDGNTEFTETSGTQALVSGSVMSTDAFAKAKVYGNLRTVSKAVIRKLKRQGKCETFTGEQARKMGIQTQGYNGSGKGFAWENRTSTLCDSDGDGDWDVRAECGNAARGRRAQPEKAKSTIWVNNFNKAKLKLRSKVRVSARSGCELTTPTGNGRVYAESYGYAELDGDVSMSMRSATKAKGNVKYIKTKHVASMTASLRTKASAGAESKCIIQGGVVVPVEPIVEPPKNSELGPGTTTPGQPGGAGAGGQPGTNNGETCRDTTDSSTGDRNANTEGDIVAGKADQFGLCV